MKTIEYVDDHKPLNNTELLSLLAEADGLAEVERNCQRLAQIQCRLGDAIPGMTCPNPIDSPVAEKLNELDSLYVEAKNAGKLLDPSVVSLFQELLS
jgi:hypothetical protein